jgi:hypothetical protein
MEATKTVNIMWLTLSQKHTFILGWTIGKYKLNDKRTKDGKAKIRMHRNNYTDFYYSLSNNKFFEGSGNPSNANSNFKYGKNNYISFFTVM